MIKKIYLMILIFVMLLGGAGNIASGEEIAKEYEGSFMKFKEGSVTIRNRKTHVSTTFQLAPNVEIINKDQIMFKGKTELQKKDIFIHSTIKLIVINKKVVKIILLEVPS